MPQPLATVTVPLPRPVTGSELMAAVKAVAEQEEKEFYSDYFYDDGDAYLMGQASADRYEHVLVAPARDSLYVHLDASYDRVVVMSHLWPSRGHTNGSTDQTIKAVRHFAEALTGYLSGLAKSETPSVWPQAVTVCALCGKIVMPRPFDPTVCPKDGKNPPVRTMMVVPTPS